MFKVNPAAFSTVFVLPGEVADRHLKLCGESQLKVLLWLYRKQAEPTDLDALCAGTGLSAGDALDACAYWTECGLLLEEDAAPVRTAETPPVQSETAQTDDAREKTPREKITVKPQKPTFEQIRRRLDESAALRDLFTEAQVQLGRTIGTGDQATLLLLHDYYGLPPDVVLILCAYARARGKTGNLNYIYTMGADWSAREIDTFDRANEELSRLQAVDGSWTQLCKRTGIKSPRPTASQQKYLGVWLRDWGFSLDMVALAFEKMSERTDGMRFSYLNGILKNWREKGILTPDAAAGEERAFREKKADRAQKPAKPAGGKNADAKVGLPDSPASYDLERAQREAMARIPVHKKRKNKQDTADEQKGAK